MGDAAHPIPGREAPQADAVGRARCWPATACWSAASTGELLALSPYTGEVIGKLDLRDPMRLAPVDRQPHHLRPDRFRQAHCAPLTTAHPQRAAPRVAIVGRPNVGKSTLFNRLVGKRRAIVDDTPGVTRDVREAPAQLGDLAFTLLDTAGWETTGGEALEARMRRFTERAIERLRRRAVPDRRARRRPAARRELRRLAAQAHRQGDRGRQQVRGPRRPERAGRSARRWAWASRSRSRPSTARA